MSGRITATDRNVAELTHAARALRDALDAEGLATTSYLCMMVGGLASAPNVKLTKKQRQAICEYFARHTRTSTAMVAGRKKS